LERIALVFPGQGSQYPGMGKLLYEEHQEARDVFNEANEVLGYDLASLCFNGTVGQLGNPEKMFPAILTVSVAAYKVYMKLVGIKPVLCAGHSLGEYAAMTCSGMMEFKDALKIVALRGVLANKVTASLDGIMTVVDGIDKFILQKECEEASTNDKKAVISCYNSDEQFVIAGNQDAVMKVEDNVLTMGGTVTPMFMSAPFHSFIMEEASSILRGELEKCSFEDGNFPVISNVEARPYAGKECVVDLLSKQLVYPVRWKEIMDYFKEQKINLVIELGPQNILRNLSKINMKTVQTFSFLNVDDIKTLMEFTLKDRKKYFSVVDECLKVAASVPNKNWEKDEYRETVVESYKSLEQLRFNLINEGRNASEEEAEIALSVLKEVLKGKKVSEENQQQLVREVLTNSGLILN